jgi:hypothetical protein
MLSTPAPIPMSIWPSEIMRAMWLTATRPDEHCLLTVATEEVVGKPANSGAGNRLSQHRDVPLRRSLIARSLDSYIVSPRVRD